MRYAIIQNGKVENIVIAQSAMESNWVLISDGSQVSIGWLYDGETFTAPPDTRPNQVKITGIMKNGTVPMPLSNRAVIKEGESLGVTARFQTASGDLLQVTDLYGMPIYQLGGIVAQTVGVQFYDGTAQILVSFPGSGEYVVTAEGLNLHLPEGSKIDFDSFYISVLKGDVN